MDDTRIDAAPTPAHIFAYRAFRSVFVRSPESSPVRPPQTETQHTSDNKENTRTSMVRGSRFVTSPVRGKRDAESVPENLNPGLTPKRQRTNSVSPAKSILKKANIPTPRRAGLRDVTVTFKDVRLSVSPELARRGSPTKARSRPDTRTTLAALSSAVASTPAPKVVTATRAGDVHQINREDVVPRVTADFDLDGYVAQTEKEMRRLIKYGQKWRELARKQDQENTKLKALLDELQKENKSLRQRDAAAFHDIKSLHRTKTADPSTLELPETREPKRRNQSYEEMSKIRHNEREKWKIPLDNINNKKWPSKSERVPAKAQEFYEMQPDMGRDTHESRRQTDFRNEVDENIIDNSALRLPYEIHPPRYREEKSLSKELPPSTQGLRSQAEHVLEPSNTVSGSLPEEDRKAAARERLRLRREAKAASIRTSSAPVARSSEFSHGQTGVDNEESQVDWMAMA